MFGMSHEESMNSAGTETAIHPRRGLAISLALSLMAGLALVGCSSPASSGSSNAPSTAPSSPAPSSGAVSNDEGATVNVTLTEWAVILDKTSVPAGDVLFNVTNAGTQFKHEFIVIKSDLAIDALPADST